VPFSHGIRSVRGTRHRLGLLAPNPFEYGLRGRLRLLDGTTVTCFGDPAPDLLIALAPGLCPEVVAAREDDDETKPTSHSCRCAHALRHRFPLPREAKAYTCLQTLRTRVFDPHVARRTQYNEPPRSHQAIYLVGAIVSTQSDLPHHSRGSGTPIDALGSRGPAPERAFCAPRLGASGSCLRRPRCGYRAGPLFDSASLASSAGSSHAQWSAGRSERNNMPPPARWRPRAEETDEYPWLRPGGHRAPV
jgi:hypothetical protein